MIRESFGPGGMTQTFATSLRTRPDSARMRDPARIPEATRGTQDRQRTDGSERTSAAERPNGGSFGERIAEARRTAERESARRMQARVEQAAGRETQQALDPDLRDAPDSSAPGGAGESGGVEPQASGQTSATATATTRDEKPSDAQVSGSIAASDTGPAAVSPSTRAIRAPTGAANAAIDAYASDSTWANYGSHTGGSAGNGADVDVDASGDADPGARTGAGVSAGNTVDLPASASAASTPSDLDADIFGVRDEASGHDPADFASRLAQADSIAAVGPTGFAAAPPATSGTPTAGVFSIAGPAPVHVGGIATPLADPAFAGHLAGESLKLAIAGIERAEISLQPKELGPIRIELSLNGESARIAFTATQPDTRQAIEQSLPILEDMLAEHGLLLADADVFDQREGDAAGRQRAGATASDSGHDSERKGERGAAQPGQAGSRAADGVPPSLAIRRGLVDLYA